MKLYLRNLTNTYSRIKKSGRNEVFYDEINSNMIIFKSYDKEVDTDSICNSIRDKAYTYLINELNNNKNIIVYWSQVEGTTSDYNIYYDLNPSDLVGKTYKEIVGSLPSLKTIFAYKYVEIKNGIERKITETIEK